jgi:hypothetical protein
MDLSVVSREERKGLEGFSLLPTLPELDGDLPDVEVDEVLRLVRYERAK